VRPLLEAWDEHARYGVVLADREKARFFVIAMGEIHEILEIVQEPPVKHRSAAGSDHMRSQMVLQRRAAKYSEEFLKDATDRLRDVVDEYHVEKVVLAGPEEVTAELQRLLPKALQLKVMERIKISVNARASEVLEVSYPAIENIERKHEREMVHDLVTMAHKTQGSSAKATLGLDATLSAANQGRIYRLVYPNGSKMSGFQCHVCDVLLDHAPSDLVCPYCSKPLEETDDLVWPLSEKVLATGGKVEEIRDPEARMELVAGGQVGAYLR
jgi:peptide subunit release factor 1 (eRF1)